jgi:hypothetical protein
MATIPKEWVATPTKMLLIAAAIDADVGWPAAATPA